jgi:hypothetical protein
MTSPGPVEAEGRIFPSNNCHRLTTSVYNTLFSSWEPFGANLSSDVHCPRHLGHLA